MTKDNQVTYKMGKKDMRVSGFLMPGAEVLDEGFLLKNVLLHLKATAHFFMQILLF